MGDGTEYAIGGNVRGRNVPTRMLVFDRMLTQDQAESVKQIYRLLFALPADVQRAIAKDWALHVHGSGDADPA